MVNHVFHIRCKFKRSRKCFSAKVEVPKNWANCMTRYLQQHIRALKVSGEYDIEAYLTATIELKLGKATRLKWTEHSSKCEMTPLYEELLEFLKVQATTSHKSVMQDHYLRPLQEVHIRQGQVKAVGTGAAGAARAAPLFTDDL